MPPSKRWLTLEPDSTAVARMASDFTLPEPLARALVNRGMATPEEAEGYLTPRLERMTDPFLLPGMRPAVDRIWKALAARERILVFGDYDVDGVSSSALMTRVLTRLGGDVRNFIPHRIDDGYGLQVDSLLQCLEAHAPTLIVTVDCGTGSVAAVQEATRRGVDVIVTDHHEVSDQVAPALAVVNPKLGEDAGLQTLAGVGVAFKLCHGLVKQGRLENRPRAADLDLREHLDLVCLGTIADMVPLRGENRILARHGLARLGRHPSPGLHALMSVAGVKEAPGSYHVGFLIGPRLNAAGRMDHPDVALRLLLSEDQNESWGLARDLDAANRERQLVEEQTVREALAQVEATHRLEQDFALVVHAAGWHPGVIGIVASRLVQRYHRPTAVIAVLEDGTGKGSCRSIEGFDFIAHLRGASARLRKYGGHTMAAGLEIGATDIGDFRREFNEAAAATLRGRDLAPTLRIDAWVKPADLNEALVEQTERLMPFGLGNPTPVWAAAGLRIRSAKWMGREQKHYKLTFDGLSTEIEAVAFNVQTPDLPSGTVDAAFQLRTNTYNGVTRLQLQLQDMRPV